ncbi:MAG: DUF6288 domain-containing protein [Lentisphaeria bacterium]|nr:DUF6288 domain-containing protein [Lentisphaeria bacterium]
MTFKSLVCVFAGSVLSLSVGVAAADVRPVLYSPHAARFECHMNMGPTGAKAWMRGYDLQVMSIDQGSPADGVLMLGDVVYNAGGTTFGPDADPRMTLGNAIGQAEATGKPLTLRVVRHGGKRKVNMSLPKLGEYSPTWPAKCDTSTRILDAACRQLLNTQLPDGKVVTDGGMGVFLTGLLLLASGEPEFLDGARRAAYHAASLDYLSIDYCNWPMGYGGVLLAEYYLATGDDSVLPKLGDICRDLAMGQMNCGSWGHSSPSGGYGALNQPGIICALALVLGKECGVAVDQTALDKALSFFGKYAMLGSIPYGDHMPWPALDDNGHNASAAILMKLAGKDAESAAFSESVAASYWMREEGHTGGFFSLVWGPLGAALAGQEKFQTFMDYQRWYYTLCRTWKGDLILLPYQEALTRFDDSSYIYFGGDFTTGGLALAFALPKKRLRIMGAGESVFSPNSGVEGDLLAARDHYLARRWGDCDRVLAGMKTDTLKTATEKGWLKQLQAAREVTRASTEQVLLEIESNMIEGAAYRASEQYSALKRCLGEAGDDRFAQLDGQFADSQIQWYIREGKQYYDAWENMQAFAVKSWVPQGAQAKRLIEGLPTLRQPIWEPLSPTSQLTPQPWRTLLPEKGEDLPKGWETISFDDRAWKETNGVFTRFDQKVEGLDPEAKAAVLKNLTWQEKKALAEMAIAARRVFTVDNPAGVRLRIRLRTVRPAETRVYLNGQQVVEAVRGQRGGYAAIELDETARQLLKKGQNLLAVWSSSQGTGSNHLDAGVDINRVAIEKRALPVQRVDHPVMNDRDEDADFTLRVREPKNKAQRQLRADYDRKGNHELVNDLADRVAFRRDLAEDALVAQGLEGIQPVVEQAGNPDWKVRASVCRVLAKAQKAFKKAADEPGLAYAGAQIPTLAGLLSDDHFWVRVQAAVALAEFGDLATAAVPELLKRVNDPDEWARAAAIRTIQAVDTDADSSIAAALEALNTPGTAYTAPRIAFSLLKKYPEGGDGRLEALITLLRNPPQGGGGLLLVEAMAMAESLDPGGEKMIPVLIEIVSDKTGYSRQRGNPRAKAIELLGKYGAKASQAVPLLKHIVASEEKKDQGVKEICQRTLDAIKGK